MKDLTLLAIDDDDLILQALKIGVPNHWRVVAVSGIPQEKLSGRYHAAFVDMHLSGNLQKAEGLDVIRDLRERMPHLSIIAMSGDLDRDLMEKCLRAGAARYIAKPLNIEEIRLSLDKIEALLDLQAATFRHPDHKTSWVGSGPASMTVLKQIANLKGEPGPILIEGESGTGKEVVTWLLHQQEAERPIIAINVAAIPENLFESELFGHVRGAFTGADQNKAGLVEAAQGGDLFLDEIEALAPHHQAKLLRFLETGELRRIGSKESIYISTRIIAATNKNLNTMVKAGDFREDLLWRLNNNKITLPPLRDRREEIPELAKFFLSRDKNRKKGLMDETIQSMMTYEWPGNVRELKRVCEQLALTSPLPLIRRDDFIKVINPASTPVALNSLDLSQGLEKAVGNYERDVIAQILKQTNDIEETIRILQVSRSNLYKKIKDYAIDWRTP